MQSLEPNDFIIELKKVSYSTNDLEIYKDLSINIPRGKITAILGPSGSGKTTLLKLISGAIIPQSGDVLFNGESISHASNKELFAIRKKMGMLFQAAPLFSDLNCFDNVAYPLQEHTNLNSELIRQIVLMKLEAVGLRGISKLLPCELSGGMQRRVSLARALALDPSLMMYDEPFAGQDPIGIAVLLNLISKLNSLSSMTSIIVSHDIQEVLQISDYCYIIYCGNILAQGTPQDILNSTDPLVEQFLNANPNGPISFHRPAPDYLEELFHN